MIAAFCERSLLRNARPARTLAAMPMVSDRDKGLVDAVHAVFGWRDAEDVVAFAFNFRRGMRDLANGGRATVDGATHELVITPATSEPVH